MFKEQRSRENLKMLENSNHLEKILNSKYSESIKIPDNLDFYQQDKITNFGQLSSL